MSRIVEIWTDGACSQIANSGHGPGGYGAIIVGGDINKEVAGSEAHTTNQRMELTAVIEALKEMGPSAHIRIHSDSAYIINAITEGWIERWMSRNWTTSARKAVANVDLWQALLEEEAKHEVVEWVKVKGHAADTYNNRADALAVQMAAQASLGPASRC